MIKTLIAPVQAWLLSQKRCVGCGRELDNQHTKESTKVRNGQKVTCECGRIFIHEKESNRYRRALFSEI